MKTKVISICARACALALLVVPSAARACDACMGGKDPNLRPAINGAIFFMLGMVGLMAGMVGYCIYYLAKRSGLPLAPHEQLMMTMSEGTNHV